MLNGSGLKLKDFDTAYAYKGFVLVNERYEDDEGFFKNCWQWGLQAGEFVIKLEILDGLSSNSYAEFSEALEVFKNKVESK